MPIGGHAMRLALLAGLLFLAVPAFGQDRCLHGCPTGAPVANRLIVRPHYTLSNDGVTKMATWVAYRILEETIDGTRNRSWRGDPDIPNDDRLEPGDYVGANAALQTDRGHQAALASLTGIPGWQATNFLSNITPQDSDLNQGPWLRIETAERELIRIHGFDEVFSITWPLYDGNSIGQLPRANEPHRTPTGYWKIVAVDDDGFLRVAAFVFPQRTPRNRNFCWARHLVTVDEVERRTGLDFFRSLSANVERAVERNRDGLRSEIGCAPFSG